MTDLYLGLISGTSADAIDVALVAFEPTLALVEHASHAYPRDLRARILELSQASALVSLDEANVPEGVIDLMVALTFPQRFIVERGGGTAPIGVSTGMPRS